MGKLRRLSGKGRRRKAPETPMEVKVETTRAMRGGMSGLTSTPDTGKSIPQILFKLTRLSRKKFSGVAGAMTPGRVPLAIFEGFCRARVPLQREKSGVRTANFLIYNA
jgi:hypothetical protein